MKSIFIHEKEDFSYEEFQIYTFSDSFKFATLKGQSTFAPECRLPKMITKSKIFLFINFLDIYTLNYRS